MIHAFFKALLFLFCRAVIHLLDDEHDMFRMGGLYKKMPVVFVTSLSAELPVGPTPGPQAFTVRTRFCGWDGLLRTAAVALVCRNNRGPADFPVHLPDDLYYLFGRVQREPAIDPASDDNPCSPGSAFPDRRLSRMPEIWEPGTCFHGY